MDTQWSRVYHFEINVLNVNNDFIQHCMNGVSIYHLLEVTHSDNIQN